jgi:hypothetical protein
MKDKPQTEYCALVRLEVGGAFVEAGELVTLPDATAAVLLALGMIAAAPAAKPEQVA